ncbi:8-oxo-dGTPase [Sulfurivirga caldicuralii]|uniref:8-oxo-dGTP diphosphatase n=1 Tax=Sulfurivirga caldicuralii TaxID=364032 RepID=A0A1N6DW87_9GAMM|nr:Nudix family hydrolase [Sulfurivirga caldicuralii]SIN75058.1 8-oxo-dGTPase [Sulfurivirga caldicuralii]
MAEKNAFEKVGDPPVEVAVGVLRQGDQVLLEQRSVGQHQGGKWAFPGGKIESGETPEVALRREFHEETGLDVKDWSPLITIPWDYGDRQVRLHVFVSSQFAGTPQQREGQRLTWWPLSQLDQRDFPAANRGIVRALRLPLRYAITGRWHTPNQLYDQVAGLLSKGLRLIQWRAPDLPRGDYLQHAKQLQHLVAGHGGQLILNGDPSLLMLFPQAAGLQLPSRYLPYLTTRPVPPERLLGISVHNENEMAQALKLAPDFLVLSPVQATSSHPDQAPLGWERFAELVAQSPLPVYALGGVGDAELAQAREAGAQGIAAISSWWNR